MAMTVLGIYPWQCNADPQAEFRAEWLVAAIPVPDNRASHRGKRPMMTRSMPLAAGLFLLTACASQPATPPITDATIQAHVDRATQLADGDLNTFIGLCKPVSPTRPTVGDKELAGFMSKPAPTPGRAFDNLFFLGDAWVSAWAIKTSDGIILLDALNNGKEAARLIEGGMRRVGLDPRQIKIIIVTHGHGDHYGGVRYLQERYHPEIVMGEADWKMTSTKLDFETPLWDPPPVFDPTHDMSAKDGDTVTLGDTVVTLYATPGHTMGTMSPSFDVTWHGEKHKVLEWGGTGFNFGSDFQRFDAYIASTKRMHAVVEQQGIDTLISNHSGVDEAPAKLARLRTQPHQPNPFVLGVPTVARAMDVMNECAVSQRERFTIHPEGAVPKK
jgi:metallo-beta-lactamase class B